MDTLLFITFFYIPTAIIFAIYLKTRKMSNKKQAAITTLLAWLIINLLLVCYGEFRCMVDHEYRGTLIGYSVVTISTTLLSGPLLVVSARRNWNPVLCFLLCTVLPLLSFVIAEFVMTELGQTWD
jgi:hypothetical protein